MLNKQEMLSVSAMLNACTTSMTVSIKLKNGQIDTLPCDKTAWLDVAQRYAKHKGVQKVTVRAVIDGKEYLILTATEKDIILDRQALEMTQEWNATGWAITREHKLSLITKISEWACDVAKHDEASWLSMEDENLMHYIAWVCRRVCRDDRYNPVFWRKFGFTESEIRRIIY